MQEVKRSESKDRRQHHIDKNHGNCYRDYSRFYCVSLCIFLYATIFTMISLLNPVDLIA